MRASTREVMIEVTRRCNMTCEHCLRGKAQNVDQKKSHIDKLFSQLSYVSEISFTGGEPSLVPEIIEYALESAKRHGVGVGGFFVATNGKKVTAEFAVACLKWYAYCEDNESTAVVVSNDNYHDAIDREYAILDSLTFYSERQFTKEEHIIPQGNARHWGSGTPVTKEEFRVQEESEDEIYIEEGLIYLNCRGKLVGGCDWSYANQRHHEICKVGELSLEALEDFGADIDYLQDLPERG